MTFATAPVVGRLIRSSNRDFVFASQVPEPDMPLFGSWVKAPAQRQQTEVFGLVYNIAFTEDELTRQIAATPNLPPEYILDGRNRQIPIEVSVLAVGYRRERRLYQALPPQPPVTLDQITACLPDEIVAFTERLDYLRLVTEARETPVDELMTASVRYAAAARPTDQRPAFIRQAGLTLARLLARDLARLESVLNQINTPF